MEDSSGQSLLFQFILLLILTLLSAFFSASEMALVSLNRSRVEQKAEEGDKKFIRLLKVLENPNNFLSTIQVGITFIGLLQGASLSASLGAVIATWFGNVAWAKTAGSVVSLVVLTYISIVFGELYPKRIAMNLKENLAIYSAPVIIVTGKIVSPFVWILSASTNLLSRLTPMTFDDADEPMTRDEIEYMLTKSEDTLEAEEIEMLQGIFSLDELMAREVMVPRTDAFMIDIEDDTQENIQAILKQSFSRIPVYEDNKDKIIGVIHTKKLLKAAYELGFENVNLRRIMNEPLFVPETIFVDDLLAAFRNTNNQMAILLDEYGGVAGLVTFEDLLEEIVGEIQDEFDEERPEVEEESDKTYSIDGKMLLEDVNDLFGLELNSNSCDTIGGWVYSQLDYPPQLGQSVKLPKAEFLVEELDNIRITRLKVKLLQEPGSIHQGMLEEQLNK